MNHIISLEEAKKMTALFRSEREKILKEEYRGRNILPLAEKFDTESVRHLIDQPGCTGLRIYMGMKDDLTVHSILVGVDEQDEDMLPATVSKPSSGMAESLNTDSIILEDAIRCPSVCPKPSPLNT
jgi:hypothetical protein